ncbi:MAG: HD domain-containing protein [Deltaproteobacteria bacterium]|nr:HD domain-containing protein [Deltaproteobacteria bacterium]
MHIRDPIHGAIEVTPDEQALIDSPQYQRLRNVKQLGFAELAFPGATHTRYSHGLGAMAQGTRLFEQLAPGLDLAAPDLARLRQILRLAVLFHDLGHAPLSHATERIMPPASALAVPEWTRAGKRIKQDRQADHEDYTLKLILDSGLAAEIEERMEPFGIKPAHVAALVCGQPPPGENPFLSKGRDLLPLLRQLVSGELDADRMDYLQRDSFFTGVNYGKFDVDWIVQNLASIEREGKVHLALQRRAVFAFEDFLLSRYHMFLGVYLHHASVGYETLLQKFCETSQGEYALPADIDEYLQHDDVALLAALRKSTNPWARRVVRRQGFRLLVERGPNDRGLGNGDEAQDRRDLDAQCKTLDDEGIDAFVTSSRGVLSTYGKDATLWVITPNGEVPIAQYTELYERYAEAAALVRLYVVPERADEARRILDIKR